MAIVDLDLRVFTDEEIDFGERVEAQGFSFEDNFSQLRTFYFQLVPLKLVFYQLIGDLALGPFCILGRSVYHSV